MKRSYYDVLKINPDSTLEEIKKSYKSLVLIHHTDKTRTSARENIQLINQAYHILVRQGVNSGYLYNIFGDNFLKYLQNDKMTELFTAIFSKFSIILLFIATLLLILNIIIFPYLIYLYQKKTIKYFSFILVPTYLSLMMFIFFGFFSYFNLNHITSKDTIHYISMVKDLLDISCSLIFCLMQIIVISIFIDRKKQNLKLLHLLPYLLNEIYNLFSDSIYKRSINKISETEYQNSFIILGISLRCSAIFTINEIITHFLKYYAMIIIMILSLRGIALTVKLVLIIILCGLLTGSAKVWKINAKNWVYIGYIVVYIFMLRLLFMTTEYEGVDYIFYVIFVRILKLFFFKFKSDEKKIFEMLQ